MKPSVALAGLLRHRRRADNRRASPILALFTIGFLLSSLGLIGVLPRLHEETMRRKSDLMIAFGVVYFGAGLVVWLISSYRTRPRVIPYFAREIEPYGGPSSQAFARGRSLYLAIDLLDELAGTLGVAPLSSFGFADDFYGQEVRWHRPAEGLRTVEALQQGVAARSPAPTDLVSDLDALAAVLRRAAERGVDFSLALRPSKDSLQVVSSMEARQGRFW